MSGLVVRAVREPFGLAVRRDGLKKELNMEIKTSRKMLRQFQLSTGLRMKIYTKTNFFLAEIKQKSWISCYF